MLTYLLPVRRDSVYEEYQFDSFLGKGGYGTVYNGVRKRDGVKVGGCSHWTSWS